MTVRLWPKAAAALALAATLTAIAPAQRSKLNLDPEETRIFNEIRDAKKPFVKESNPQDTQKNTDAIKRAAQIEIARFLDAAGSGSSDRLALAVRNTQNVVLNPLQRGKALTEGQRDLIKIFGDEYVAQVRPLLTGAKDNDMVRMVNAAMQLAIVARSGAEATAQLAVDIVNDPKQHDAVKLYALEALHNVFAVPDPEDDAKSVFKDKALESKAIKTLIDFIARKPEVSEKSPEDEIEALRWVRRAAVKALGKVRKATLRDQDDKVVLNPAVVLLRVANADRNLVPAPNIAERVEALVGFLTLQADKDTNMDFAAGFVATAIHDLTNEYRQKKTLERIKADDPAKAVEAVKAAASDENKRPRERDYHPWKLTANRIQVALKVWRDNYENPRFGLRPDDVKSMMDSLIKAANDDFLAPVISNRTSEVGVTNLEAWNKGVKFTSQTLVNADKAAVIVRP